MRATRNSRHPGGRRDLLRHETPASAGVTALLGACALMLHATPTLADSNLPPTPLAYTQLPDPAQEAQAKALMETLRCVVCQGQSIADSDAEMAGDMRAIVRERIAKGESPKAIRAWMVERYGDYVTYDPPFSWVTAPLWIAPVLLLVLGVLIARRSFGKGDDEREGEGEGA